MTETTLESAAREASRLLLDALGDVSPNTLPFAEAGNCVLATPMSTIEREMNVTSMPSDKILVDRAQYEKLLLRSCTLDKIKKARHKWFTDEMTIKADMDYINEIGAIFGDIP
jgi:hypothetical protein